MIHRLGRFFLTSLSFLLCAVFFAHPIMAGNYGDGNFGSGNYGEGQTPAPTAVATSTTTSSSGSSSNAAPPAPQGCGALAPSGAPDLFQIDSTSTTSVRLYFSPVSSNRDRYFVSYGSDASAQGNGFEIMSTANGVIATDVKSLAPKMTYYFKVRAGNGCMPGNWSGILAATAGQRSSTYRWKSIAKVIKTAVARVVKPKSVEVAEHVTSTPSPSAPPVIATAAPVQTRIVESPATATPEVQTGFFSHITNFFRRIFEKK